MGIDFQRDIPAQLSESGEQRREAMLGSLLVAVRMRRRGRALARGMACGAAMFAIVLGGFVLVRGVGMNPTHVTPPRVTIAGDQERSGEEARVLTPADPDRIGCIQIVRDDVTVTSRWTASAKTEPEFVTDGQLIAAISDAGFDGGLMRVGDRAEVVWNTR